MRRIVLVLALTAATLVAAPIGAAFAATAGTFHATTPARVVSTTFLAKHSGTFTIGGHGGVPSTGAAAVAATISAVSPTASGALIAWAAGATRPSSVSIRFTATRSATNGAIIPLSTTGKIQIFNDSGGSVLVTVDVSGYYSSGSATYAGAFHALPLTHAYGAASLSGSQSLTAPIGGRAGVPSAGVGAVAINVTISASTQAGSIILSPSGGPASSDPVIRFAAHQTVTTFALVPVSATGRLVARNTAVASVTVSIDVEGYFSAGIPTGAAETIVLPAVLAKNATLAAHGSLTVPLGGKGGVALAGVTAAIVTLSVLATARPGTLVAYKAGTSVPGTRSLSFAAGQIVATTTMLVPVSSASKITITNTSTGTAQIVVDVSGYVRSTTVTPPATLAAHFIRSLAALSGLGCSDASSRLVVLHIGAQLNDHTGVQFSATSTNVTYASLVTALKAYLDDFHSCAGAGTLAIATNNDGNFATSVYSGTLRGQDWANKIVDPLAAYVSAKSYAGVTIAGADDIEPDFTSTEAQAEAWEAGYLGATTAGLYFIGSADGCPTTYAAPAPCSAGWTQAQLYKLSHGINTSRVQALPQIFTPSQAVQWANIGRAGGSTAGIIGALTEFGACPAVGTGCTIASLRPGAGWAALRNALASVVASPSLHNVLDFDIRT